jgi:hypothetical protein
MELTEHFEVELDAINEFTLIPVSDGEGELQIRSDGIVYDGDLHLWEEIKSFKITRKEKGE